MCNQQGFCTSEKHENMRNMYYNMHYNNFTDNYEYIVYKIENVTM